MLPLIIVGGAALLYLIDELASETGTPKSEFNSEDIITVYAKIFKSTEETKAKTHITKTINKLIKKGGTFKVGKSGSPDDRNSKHKQFNKMYILAESENKNFINKLESIYNEKYISVAKNQNQKIGSAGVMTNKTGKYYLYLISNSK